MTYLFQHPNLVLLKVDLEFQVSQDIFWNSFPGSVVHGGLSFIFRQKYCITKLEKCADCFLEKLCSYARLFNPIVSADDKRRRIYNRAPAGLRLSVEPWNKQISYEGERIKVGLVLFGRTVFTIGMLITALEEIFQQGIGRKQRNGERGGAELCAFHHNSAVLSAEDYKAAGGMKIKTAAWEQLAGFDAENFTIELISPLRIQSKGKIASTPAFSEFITALLRRIDNLAYYHCDTKLEFDYRALLQKAKEVKNEAEFSRQKMSRYSARQEQRMSMDGVTGRMKVYDCPAELRAWIGLGQATGVGKNTSMGMGEYQIEEKKSNYTL